MARQRILHLEDDSTDALLVQRTLERGGIEADVTVATGAAQYRAALDAGGFDLILSDHGVPGFSGNAALELARQKCAHVPFIFVSGAVDETRAMSALEEGVTDYVVKGQLWQLVRALRRLGAVAGSKRETEALSRRNSAMARLVAAVQELSLARTMDAVMAVVRRAARELTGADGATFVLRDDNCCYYADEDAIEPLWKGQRFPMSACISGWSMLNRQSAVIEDIYADPRIPADAYRPTFVKSLVMVPIRLAAPVGAIGTYWASRRLAAPEEVDVLQALANTTAVAIEDVQLFTELEQRVADRTAQLKAANRELEAFSYSVSHDLRAPLRNIGACAQFLTEEWGAGIGDKAQDLLARIKSSTEHMNALIEDLLRLAKFSRMALKREAVNLSAIARELAERLRAGDAKRVVEFKIEEGLKAQGDAGLLRVVLENLLSNGWKYTAKRAAGVVEFGAQTLADGSPAFFVRDNGAGFDMSHAGQLFTPFQRLHGEHEFPGHGVGLATVQRIIERHSGRIWAEAEVDKGASFYFTLPAVGENSEPAEASAS